MLHSSWLMAQGSQEDWPSHGPRPRPDLEARPEIPGPQGQADPPWRRGMSHEPLTILPFGCGAIKLLAIEL